MGSRKNELEKPKYCSLPKFLAVLFSFTCQSLFLRMQYTHAQTNHPFSIFCILGPPTLVMSPISFFLQQRLSGWDTSRSWNTMYFSAVTPFLPLLCSTGSFPFLVGDNYFFLFNTFSVYIADLLLKRCRVCSYGGKAREDFLDLKRRETNQDSLC